MPNCVILIDMPKVTQLMTADPSGERLKSQMLFFLFWWQVGSHYSALPSVLCSLLPLGKDLDGLGTPQMHTVLCWLHKHTHTRICIRLKGSIETPSRMREIWSGSSQPKSLIYFYFNTQLPQGENRRNISLLDTCFHSYSIVLGNNIECKTEGNKSWGVIQDLLTVVGSI